MRQVGFLRCILNQLPRQALPHDTIRSSRLTSTREVEVVILDTILLVSLVAFSVRIVLSLSPAGGLLLVAGLACLLAMAQLIMVGTVLLLLDAYSVRTALAFCALASPLICVALEFRERAFPSAVRQSVRLEAPLAGCLLVAAIVIGAPGFQVTPMGSDAGVYVNRALQLSKDGALFPKVGIDVARLPDELRTHYLADNIRTAGFHRPVLEEGAKLRISDGESAVEFHGLPGWPILLSVSAHLAGIENLLAVSTLILFALVALMYATLMAVGRNALVAAAMALVTLSLPLVAYFARYPTAELFLALVTVGLVSSLLYVKRAPGTFAGLLVAVYSLVHVTGFVLLIVASIYAVISAPMLSSRGRAILASFLFTAGIGHGIAFSISRHTSNGYVTDLLVAGFGSEMWGRWTMYGIDAFAVGLAVSLYVLARRSSA